MAGLAATGEQLLDLVLWLPLGIRSLHQGSRMQGLHYLHLYY